MTMWKLPTQLERLWQRLRHMARMARLYNSVYSSQYKMEVVGATEGGNIIRVTPTQAVAGMMSRLGQMGDMGRYQPGPSTRNYIEGNDAVALLMSQPLAALRALMERAGVEGDYLYGDDDGNHFITVYA